MDNLLGREKPKLLPLAENIIVLTEQFNDFFITMINTIREPLNFLESSSENLSYPDISSILQQGNIKIDTFSTASVSEASKIKRKTLQKPAVH